MPSLLAGISIRRIIGLASRPGDAYDERAVLALLRQKAYEIRGEQAPDLPVPAPPTLLRAAGPHAIRWQGSVGATGYDVERADQPSGPWTPVGLDVDESAVQYNPRFCDPLRRRGLPLLLPGARATRRAAVRAIERDRPHRQRRRDARWTS